MKNKNTWLNILVVIVIVGFVFEIVSAIFTVHTTGVLDVKTSDTSATLAISKANSQAQYIGINSAHVRLAPGTYLVSASDQSSRIMSSVQIYKNQTTLKTLNINSLVKTTNENNRLIEKLPVTGPASEYTISYYSNYIAGQAYPVITISTSSDKARQDAQQWFSYNGFNLNNYKVIYQTQAPLPASYNFFGG